MSTRSERIEKIINGRKPFATELKKIIEYLQGLEQSLSKAENYRQQLQDSLAPENQQKFAQLNFKELKEKLSGQSEQLKLLAERFSRDTLSIGVIGETGAGKSTLLQSLSGLDDDVIPARSGGACTAVRSKIQNLPLQLEVKAEITRHTLMNRYLKIVKNLSKSYLHYRMRLPMQWLKNLLTVFFTREALKLSGEISFGSNDTSYLPN